MIKIGHNKYLNMRKNNTQNLRESTGALYGVRTTEKAEKKPTINLERFMQTFRSLQGFQKIEYIIFHGSAAEGRAISDSDIDLCVYYKGTPEEQTDYRMRLLKKLPDKYDVQIFQQLPLYIRKEVLRGKPVYVKDKEFLHKIACDTLNEYADFQPSLMRYLREEETKPRREMILIKLKEAAEAADTIEKNMPSSHQEFDKLGLVKDGIYKKTEYAIECIIDACAILNADHALGIPSDTDDIIENLRKAKLIKDETAETIREMKAFRNVLVHKYGKIENKKAYEEIKTGTCGIRETVKEMRKRIMQLEGYK